jgi:phospholipid/cholesterol/gamma-HCH transport system substrate-binding protein
MIDRAHAITAGFFVLLLGGLFVGFAFWFGGHHGPRLPYLVVSTTPVAGLSIQSGISYRGVAAGMVQSISIDPQNPRQVLVRIDVDQGVPITRSTYAQLQVQLVTGNANLVLDDTFQNPQRLLTREDRPARIPMRPSLMDQLGEVGPRILTQVSNLSAVLTRLVRHVDAADINRILARTAQFTERLPYLERELHRTLAVLPHVARKADQSLSGVDTLLLDLERLSATLDSAGQNAVRLTTAARRAVTNINDSTVPRMNQALDELTSFSRSARGLSQRLRESPLSVLRGTRIPPGPGEPGYRAREP